MSLTTASEKSVSTGSKTGFKPYPSYQPSGLDWLDEFPEGWSAPRLGFITEVNPPKSTIRDEPEDYSVSFVPMEAIGEQGGLDLDSDKPLSEVVDGYTYFENGDVLIAKITPCFENGKGALPRNLTSGVGFGTTELHVLRPKDGIDERFLFYLTISDHFRKLGEASMYGAAGQKRVPEDFVFGFRHPLPSLPEQGCIANFLDGSTSRIDRLIDKKERLIELLEEQRIALITKAVTEGLNPDVPMKDSGVVWLDRIPEHWDRLRLKVVSKKIQTGLTLGQDYSGRTEERPYLRVANVQDGYLDLSDISTIEVPPSEVQKTALQAGDVLMTEGGDFDKLGRGYVWEEQIEGCLHQNHIFAIRVNKEFINPRFLSYLTTSRYGRAYFSATAKQSTNLASTNKTKVGNFPIPLPPREEQYGIIEALETRESEINNLQNRIRRATSPLGEYRSALISAAVTGKIDLRDQAA